MSPTSFMARKEACFGDHGVSGAVVHFRDHVFQPLRFKSHDHADGVCAPWQISVIVAAPVPQTAALSVKAHARRYDQVDFSAGMISDLSGMGARMPNLPVSHACPSRGTAASMRPPFSTTG